MAFRGNNKTKSNNTPNKNQANAKTIQTKGYRTFNSTLVVVTLDETYLRTLPNVIRRADKEQIEGDDGVVICMGDNSTARSCGYTSLVSTLI